jgi:D-glycero-alpha-D-manno-heptose-7-phosphate kinase
MPTQTVTAARRLSGLYRPPGRSAPTRTVRSRAPLRLGLAGGGTDVSPYCDLYGGMVLNATIDRYCYATVEARTDGRVRLAAPDLGDFEDLSDGRMEDARVLPIHAAVYRRMCRDFDLGTPALTITTVSDAPPGSGLGSSSTLVVSLIEAFREYFSLPLAEYEVARLAYEVERNDCGLNGGRQDQYAATFGGFNVMEFGADERVMVSPLRLKPAIVQEFEASMVLYHTGVSRSSGAIIDEQTSHIVFGEEARISATHALKDEALAMKEALLVGDLGGAAMVLNSGWEAKKRLADGISNPAIEHTFSVARDAGAIAGKLSGAGGGGYIMFMVEPTGRPALLSALSGLSPTGVQPVHFVGEGAVAWTVR